MAADALQAKNYPVLKIKLDDDEPVERIAAIRSARPDARLAVDANRAWTFEQLVQITPALAELGVEMIEQPLPRGGDEELQGYKSLIPLCADESCLDRNDLHDVSERYQMINIKLDKTGGLTRGFAADRRRKKNEH